MIQLQKIFPNGHFLLETNSEGKVGETVALLEGQPILEKGNKGDGCFAWVETRTSKGDLYIGSVYGSLQKETDCTLEVDET